MIGALLDRFTGTSEFARVARQRGLSRAAAGLLADAAAEICPGDPQSVLDSRELLERTALLVAVGTCGNLELSFPRVQQLATCFEVLGLGRTADIPDPFRRVTICDRTGRLVEGVALTCENDELAVFCPPDGRPAVGEGSVLTISYQGFDTRVEFELRLVDSCRFPGGLMLHLARTEGSGAIGRRHHRFEVDLSGTLRPHDDGQHQDDDRDCACDVLDVSMGGLRVECDVTFVAGQRVGLRLWLSDGGIDAFVAEAQVRWVRPGRSGRTAHGLLFVDLDARQERRLSTFVASLGANGSSLLG